MASILQGLANALRDGENVRLQRTPDGGACGLVRICGKVCTFKLSPGEVKTFYTWAKAVHARLHGKQSVMGLPIVDMDLAAGKTNFYKMGSAEYSMDEFKNNPFKVGEERASVMATYPNVFKMGYTRINPWRLGVEDINAFKMGGDSYAMGAFHWPSLSTKSVKAAASTRAKQITNALTVVSAAQKGDPKAKATIKHVTKLASKGDPKAKKAHADLKAAHKHLKGAAALPSQYATPERLALLNAGKGGVLNTTLAQLFSAGLRAARL